MFNEIDLQKLIENLIQNPTETLAIELKSQLDPSDADGKAKFIKACISLYNKDGGYLIIGINNRESGAQDSAAYNSKLERIFNFDKLQQLITNYVSISFPISVDFKEIDGIKYPIIIIPPGVKVPVYAKSEIKGTNPTNTIAANKVYVRSLDANGSVSSSEPKGKDWDRLMEKCFGNHEVNVGKFINRHMTASNI